MRVSEHRNHIVIVSPNPNGATTLLGILLLGFCLVPLSQPHSPMHWVTAGVFAFGGVAWIVRGWPKRQAITRDAKGTFLLGAESISPAAALIVRCCQQSGRCVLELQDDGKTHELGASRRVQQVSQAALHLSRRLERPLRFESLHAPNPGAVVGPGAPVLALAVPPPIRRVAWAAIIITLLLGVHTLYQLDVKVAQLGMAHPVSLTLAWAAILMPLGFGAVLLRRQVRVDRSARWVEWRVFGVPWVRRNLPGELPQQLAWLPSSADVLHCVVLWPKDALVLSVKASDAALLAACFQEQKLARAA